MTYTIKIDGDEHRVGYPADIVLQKLDQELETLRAENAKLIAERESVRETYQSATITLNSLIEKYLAEREQWMKQEPAACIVEDYNDDGAVFEQLYFVRDGLFPTTGISQKLLYAKPHPLPAQKVPEWETEAKRAFWTGLEIGATFGAVAILPRWDEYIAKRKGELSAAPKPEDKS